MHNIKLTLEDLGSFLAKLSEKSESVYWLSSPDFKKIQYVSLAYEKIWGRSRKLLYANPEVWITYLHPDDVRSYHPIYEMAERVAKLGSAARYEENYRIIHPNGKIHWIIDRGFPIYGSDGICYGVTGVAIDVTKEKQNEEKLRQAKEAAEAANQAKTEFLENMRHDIRTPVAGIVGCAHLIQSQASDVTKVTEFAADLVESSDALLEFLNKVLESIKVASGEIPLLKKKFDLHKVLAQIISLNKSYAVSKKLELNLVYDDAIPTYVIGDPIRIQRIVLELVTNALKFTEKGQVKVTARLRKTATYKLIIQLSVSDTGMGIPEDKQHEVYTRFKRLTPSYQGIYSGAGLGLSLVKQFMDDLGAELSLQSQVNQGSTFTCLIPLQEPLLMNSEDVEEILPIESKG